MEFSFPTNKAGVNKYPNLKKVFQKGLNNDFSSKQIFRLLDNLHYDGIKLLVEFIEMFLSKKKFFELIVQKIRTKDYAQFSSNIKEIILLNYLLKKGFNIHTFDNNKSNKRVPEYCIKNSTTEMLIEFYSPFELYGFELFQNELITAIKYYPNNLGYNCNIEIEYDKKEDEYKNRSFVPFNLNYKYSNDKLRHTVINNIIAKLLHFSEIEQREVFYLTDDIYILTSIEFKRNSNNRQIAYSTPSYDSLRYYVSIQSNSKGFYKKLLHKINSGQLNQSEYPSAHKVLFVDFSQSMGAEVLVEGMGEDFLSEAFYKNLSQILIENVSTKNVDLIFPIICRMNDDFVIGNCLFNPQNINIRNLFNAN